MSRAARFLALLAGTLGEAYAQSSGLSGTASVGHVPAPAVVVTVKSSALQGSRSSLTDSHGAYRFLLLPPGVYNVTFELQGFPKAERSIQLFLSVTRTLDVDLAPDRFSSEVTVSRRGDLLTGSPGSSATFIGEEVELLPAGRDVLSTALLSSSVITRTVGAGPVTQVVISGGPGYDNLIMVDGALIMNSNGALHTLFIEDAIQEITVLTSGISAEYGRFTGGVINTLTKSGGNRWHGSLRDTISSPEWAEKSPYPIGSAELDVINHVGEETAGGFIVKDRLWFFGAGRQARSKTPRLTSTTNIPYVFTSAENRYQAKATARLFASNTFVASFLDLRNSSENVTFNRVYDLASLVDATFPQSILSLHYDGVMARNLLVEARYSRKRFAAEGLGSPFTDLIGGTPIIDRSTSIRMHSATLCGVCGARRTFNRSYALKARHFVSGKRWGAHSVVAGLEQFSEQRTINNHLSGSDFMVFATSVQRVGATVFPQLLNDGLTFIRWTPVLRESNGNDLATLSAYVNDEWRMTGRIAANLGLRYDRNRSRDADGSPVSTAASVSPRLGLAVDLAGNGRHDLSAGYGRYVSDIEDGSIGGAAEIAGVASQIDFAYRGPAVNPNATAAGQLIDSADALRRLFEWFNSQCDAGGRCGTANLSLLRPNGARDTPGYFARIGNRLASPYVDEFYTGYALQLSPAFGAKVNAILRNWGNFYNYRVDATTPRARDTFNLDHDVAIVENTESIKRAYRALQLQAQWRTSSWRACMSYTLSALRGNDEQESQETRAMPNAALETYYSEFLSYPNRLPDGYLNQDQRHRALAWLGYNLPLGRTRNNLNVSLLQSFESGRRYSARGTIRATGYPGAPVNTQYVGGVPDAAAVYYFSKRGAFKLENVLQTDLAIRFRRTVPHGELFLQADVLNVMNGTTVISVDTTVQSATTAADLQRFNPFTEQPRPGVHYRLGPLFGQPRGPESYQRPRTYQFAAGLRF